MKQLTVYHRHSLARGTLWRRLSLLAGAAVHLLPGAALVWAGVRLRSAWADAGWLARIEQMQRQLPNDPFLQYLGGHVCLQRQLWGKAAQLLSQASTGLVDAELLRQTWCGLALLAEERGDATAAQAAWKRAAQIG